MKTILSNNLVCLVVAVEVCCSPVLSHADATNCVAPPSGLVSWWQGEGTGTDIADGNNGTLVADATFGPGKVGAAFAFDGDGDGVLIGAAANLQLQALSIEAWVKRASSSVLSFNGNGGAQLFALGGGGGGYSFYLDPSGLLAFGKLQVNAVTSSAQITDTNWHHVAVTKLGTAVVFYLDGVAYPAPTYNSGGFTFTASGYIGAWLNPSMQVDNSFYGMIDELAIYNRTLTGSEIQEIYQSGALGKCSGPEPLIITQPANRTVIVGDSPTFEVRALGTPPLAYQWRFYGTNIPAATDPVLTLFNAQFTNAGEYSVVITNSYGSATSSTAVLMVKPIPPCVAPLSGLISWWRAENNGLDTVGNNNGILATNAGFAAGRVGQGFAFDGEGNGMQIGNATSLWLQDFTIEAWISRADAAIATITWDFEPAAFLFGYGSGEYGFGVYSDGRLFLTKVGISVVALNPGITDTNIHHVAVTKNGSTVVFYIDGVAYGVPAYNSGGFVFSTPAVIGARGDTLRNTFWGTIDELSVYSRPLSTNRNSSDLRREHFGQVCGARAAGDRLSSAQH